MLAFVVGLFLGGAAGVAAMCLLVISKENTGGRQVLPPEGRS